MKRTAVLLVGLLAYFLFGVVFLYAIGFVGNFLTPTRLDGPVTHSFGRATTTNLVLLALFAFQHSVMARPGFKRWWTRFIPVSIERSIYVLATNLCLGLLFWKWQPMGGLIWDVEHMFGRAVLYTLFAAGWLTVAWTTFLTNHFDLFGLRQVWLYYRGRPYEPTRFVTPGPYKLVRHPMYLGWLMAFWSTPTMSAAHFTFSVILTAYILVAIQLEERDLMRSLGESYARYRRSVPMLVPRLAYYEDRHPETDLAPAGFDGTATPKKTLRAQEAPTG